MSADVPFSASFLQFVFKHENLFLQREVLALSVTELLLQGLQLTAMVRLPATQLLLVLHDLLLQLCPDADELRLVVRACCCTGGPGLFQWLENDQNI